MLGVAVAVAAAVAQCVQFAFMDKLEGQSGPLEYVLLVALAAFTCGAVVGYKVPVSCRINLVTPLDPIMARALRDLLAQANGALGERCRRQGLGVCSQQRARRHHSRGVGTIQDAGNRRGPAARGGSRAPARGGPQRTADAKSHRRWTLWSGQATNCGLLSDHRGDQQGAPLMTTQLPWAIRSAPSLGRSAVRSRRSRALRLQLGLA